MNKKLLMAALGACALTAAAVPAYAQSSTPTGLSLKIGILWPTDEDVRDATSDAWFTGGLEYRFHEMPMTDSNMKAHLSVSVDFAEQDDITIVPVLLNYVAENNQTYWMVGAGMAHGFNALQGVQHRLYAGPRIYGEIDIRIAQRAAMVQNENAIVGIALLGFFGQCLAIGERQGVIQDHHVKIGIFDMLINLFF